VDYVDQRHRNLDHVPDDLQRYARTLEELLLDANHIRELPKVSFLEDLSQLNFAVGRVTSGEGLV
jgi:protein scribble